MQVIICGGGGFIGQRLTRFLLDKGYEVLILDRNQSRITSPKLQSFIVDLLDTKLFDKAWFSDVEAVINLSGKDILHLDRTAIRRTACFLVRHSSPSGNQRILRDSVCCSNNNAEG